MDPLTALATITQLLGLFVQENRTARELNKQQFLAWLDRHRHEELKELICNTHHLSEQVDVILQEGQARILAEIQAVNGTLAQIMSRLHALGSLSHILTPDISLSRFALAALCHFEDSRETNLITLPDGSGVQFGNSGAIQHDEPRFLDDDIDALEACGFISIEARHTGYSVYRLTRQGAVYAKIIKDQCEPASPANPPPPSAPEVS